MQLAIAKILEIDPDSVAVKATTTENLGFVGTEDGISAYAVVLIEKF
jgi:2-C-methyl-D-erythritol 2,4-cyclodiphosphate synthase